MSIDIFKGDFMSNIQRAIKSGYIDLGFGKIPVAVLKDGTRLITNSGFHKALGRAAPAGGRSAKTPSFLSHNALKPFITKDLTAALSPIEFTLPTGGKAIGYRAEILPKICEVYLKARDENALTPLQEKYAASADLIIRALANVGIIALIDESIGYQELRDKDALQAILEKYLQKEQAAWAKRFPDEFYRQIFRLRKWKAKEVFHKKPGIVAHYTNDLVYQRLAPGLIDELQHINPIEETGYRKGYHHNHLTPLAGMPALSHHMHALLKIMKACKSWGELIELVDRFLPKQSINDLILDTDN